MKPHEFWESTYREVNLFCKMNLIKRDDETRNMINLEDALTNKMIEANPMIVKNPKIKPIRDSFKGLFEDDKGNEEQSIEEQIAILRGMKE